MSRKRVYRITKLTWTCPHCGFDHSAADLVEKADGSVALAFVERAKGLIETKVAQGSSPGPFPKWRGRAWSILKKPVACLKS